MSNTELAVGRVLYVGDEQAAIYPAVVDSTVEGPRPRRGWYPGWHGGVKPAALNERLLAAFVGRGAGRRKSLRSDIDSAIGAMLSRHVPTLADLPAEEAAARVLAQDLADLWAVQVGVALPYPTQPVVPEFSSSTLMPHWWARPSEATVAEVATDPVCRPWIHLSGDELGDALAGAIQQFAIGAGQAPFDAGAVISRVVAELEARPRAQTARPDPDDVARLSNAAAGGDFAAIATAIRLLGGLIAGLPR